MRAFDDLRGVGRSSCSGGHRHFNVMPNGDVYRCVEMYYSGAGSVVARLTDVPSMRKVFSEKDSSPCRHGGCFLQCDGQKTEQVVKGEMFHVGSDVSNLGFVGRDYCVLQVHLTSRCNWRCPYCCAAEWMAKREPDLPAELWEQAAALLCESYETGMVLLMGGEPTVHPAWAVIATTMVRSSWQVRLVTNFSTHEKVEAVVGTMRRDDRRLFSVNVSLHPTQWKSGFDEFEKSIGRITSMGARVSCTVVDTVENRRAMQAFDVERRCRAFPIDWFDYISELKK